MMMDTVINTYHRYLNLPFTIGPLPFFREQGNQIRHFYINDYPFYPMEELFSDLGLILHLKEVFYTPPFSKIPIHTDHGHYTNHAKINMTWGPEEGVIQWWKSDKTSRMQLNGYQNSTDEYHDNLWANEADCELLYEANTNRPSLVNVGVLHGTNNPTPHGRWTLCFVPVNQAGQFIHWDSALEVFKNYLEV
jgi:hypothetical protein